MPRFRLSRYRPSFPSQSSVSVRPLVTAGRLRPALCGQRSGGAHAGEPNIESLPLRLAPPAGLEPAPSFRLKARRRRCSAPSLTERNGTIHGPATGPREITVVVAEANLGLKRLPKPRSYGVAESPPTAISPALRNAFTLWNDVLRSSTRTGRNGRTPIGSIPGRRLSVLRHGGFKPNHSAFSRGCDLDPAQDVPNPRISSPRSRPRTGFGAAGAWRSSIGEKHPPLSV